MRAEWEGDVCFCWEKGDVGCPHEYCSTVGR